MSSESLQHTPTWSTAVFFSLFVSVSFLFVCSVGSLGSWLTRRGKRSSRDALERIKSELMIMGFLSLLLAAVQRPISRICVPLPVARTMLPCRRHEAATSTADAASDRCASQGKTSLVSEEGVHQLHILIFVLAVVHVLCSLLTMALGNLKMKQWKAWEMETQTLEYEVANDPRRFRLTRETTYARRHVSFWTETRILRWMTSFFRQFFSSIAKVDYFTLRHGFISAHFPTLRIFNFQRYIERSLEEDFKTVLRISPTMWLLVVIFLLIDVYGWYSYFWLSFLPLIAVLAAGTKLNLVVARMAVRVSEDAVVVSGPPTVKPSDDLFWFGRPKLVLFLIHFTLFQNAFQLSFFLWVWYEYGVSSCYHGKRALAITRVTLAVFVQVICSYITLPLYALVTQMGSKFGKIMFEETTVKVLTEWYEEARRRRKMMIMMKSNIATRDSNDFPSIHSVDNSL